MALEPNASFSERDEVERSGIFVINQGGQFVAISVRPGTPAAAAGVRDGDVIASLDGASGAQLSIASIRKAFAQPSGTVVKLGIIHAGGTLPQELVLTLADYV